METVKDVDGVERTETLIALSSAKEAWKVSLPGSYHRGSAKRLPGRQPTKPAGDGEKLRHGFLDNLLCRLDRVDQARRLSGERRGGFHVAAEIDLSNALQRIRRHQTLVMDRLAAFRFQRADARRRFLVEHQRAGFLRVDDRALVVACTGLSVQLTKRVPIWMPSAPSANAATMPRPSQMPPAAIIGTSVRARMPCSSTSVETSSGFLKPPPSAPSTTRPRSEERRVGKE